MMNRPVNVKTPIHICVMVIKYVGTEEVAAFTVLGFAVYISRLALAVDYESSCKSLVLHKDNRSNRKATI